MEQQEKNIQDYIIAIRKRKSAVSSIIAVILLLVALVAFLLPSIYKSSSTILIEQQEIPSSLVMSTVTSFAAERIQTIQARVMTRTNLLRIVDKFELYKDERRVETTEQIVERMHENVSLNVINAEVVDPRTGRPSTATIAFSLAFKGESPSKVQRVANELTTLYLNENLTSRTEKASEASKFFEVETKRLSKQIDELENKMAVFKQENADALPELRVLNLSVLQRKEQERSSLDVQLRVLDEKQFYLAEQLAQLSPGNPAVPGSLDRLKVLRAEYASIKSKYSAEHPDVIRLQNEITSLEGVTGSSDNVEGVGIAEELQVLNAELAKKRLKYTADHPDIVTLEKSISVLNNDLQSVANKPLDDFYKAQPDNPLYLSVKSQLASVTSEIESLKIQRKDDNIRISEIEKSLYKSPQVERQFLILERDYKNSVVRYQQTKSKQMQADVAKQLEADSKGEKFTLIEPATLPEKPVSPNRPAIVILGFILAMGGGLGFAIIADAISGTVRGVRGVQRSLGVFPLSVIPYEFNLRDRAKTTRIKKRIVILFIVIIVSAVLFIHFVVSPLDVLWFRILRKVDTLSAYL